MNVNCNRALKKYADIEGSGKGNWVDSDTMRDE